jgi:hypothetical protein
LPLERLPKKKYSPEFFLDKMKVLSAHYGRCNRDVIFASTLLMLGAFFSQDWVVVGDKGLFNYIDIGSGSGTFSN